MNFFGERGLTVLRASEIVRNVFGLVRDLERAGGGWDTVVGAVKVKARGRGKTGFSAGGKVEGPTLEHRGWGTRKGYGKNNGGGEDNNEGNATAEEKSQAPPSNTEDGAPGKATATAKTKSKATATATAGDGNGIVEEKMESSAKELLTRRRGESQNPRCGIYKSFVILE
jgi:hypothetical protein